MNTFSVISPSFQHETRYSYRRCVTNALLWASNASSKILKTIFYLIALEQEGKDLFSLHYYVRRSGSFQTKNRTPLKPEHEDLALEKSIARAQQLSFISYTICITFINSVENISLTCIGQICAYSTATHLLYTARFSSYFPWARMVLLVANITECKHSC